MDDFLYLILYIIIVAALWGCTNAFLKQNTNSILYIKQKTKLSQCIYDIRFAYNNIEILIPLCINYFGTLFYFHILKFSDISICVPVANSLSYVFTALTAFILGEKMPSKYCSLGMVLVTAGAILCFYSKYFIYEEYLEKEYTSLVN